jgi:putative transposase
MAFVKIWIHAVWSTKSRETILTIELRKLLCRHIQENARQNDFYIDEINGYTEHIHCLMRLRADWSIAKQMQMIKGESSFWMNKQAFSLKDLIGQMSIMQVL